MANVKLLSDEDPTPCTISLKQTVPCDKVPQFKEVRGRDSANCAGPRKRDAVDGKVRYHPHLSSLPRCSTSTLAVAEEDFGCEQDLPWFPGRDIDRRELRRRGSIFRGDP